MDELSTGSNGKNINTYITTIQMRLVDFNTVPVVGNITVDDSLISAVDLNAQLISVLLPMTIFIAIEACVGLVGNILILYIFARKYSVCNFRYFVLFLALLDLTSCLTALPGEMYVQINWYTMQLEWICKMKSYFNVLTVWGSGQIIFLMALDRYRKVCRPLGRQIPSSLARKLGFCTIVISSLAALPVVFLWGKQTYTIRYKGYSIAVSTCEKSDEYEHTLYPAIYIIITYSFPVGVLMLIAATLNIMVSKTVFCNLENVDDINVSNTNDEKAANESNDYVRHHSNSTKRVNIECTAADEQPHMEIRSISTISDSVFAQSFNEFLDIREFLSNRIIVPQIKYKDVHHNSNTETQDIESSGSKCLTEFEDDLVQVETNQVSENNDVNFQTLSYNTNIMPGQNTAGVQNSATKSVISELVNGKSQNASKKKNNSFQNRVRRKTLIMLILTSVFVVTTVTYTILISFVAKEAEFLQNLSDTQKVFFFFFLRLYFVNSAMNPILYGILDPRFRQGLKTLVCSEKQT
ncbi:hypothetical protein CHS0354_034335, partial [Potamilus streckersoni]